MISVKVKAAMAKYATHTENANYLNQLGGKKSVFCMALWFCHKNEHFFPLLGNF